MTEYYLTVLVSVATLITLAFTFDYIEKRAAIRIRKHYREMLKKLKQDYTKLDL